MFHVKYAHDVLGPNICKEGPTSELNKSFFFLFIYLFIEKSTFDLNKV